MNRFALITAAGLATVASAQTATISYDFGGVDTDMLAENTEYSVTAVMSFADGLDNLLAVSYDVAIAGALAGIDSIALDDDYLAQGGGVSFDGSTLAVSALGPSSILVPAAGSPQALFTFTLTTGSAGSIDFAHSNADIQTFNAQFQLAQHEIVDSDGSWTVVPTPGALAVAGLGGLVAARRRRA